MWSDHRTTLIRAARIACCCTTALAWPAGARAQERAPMVPLVQGLTVVTAVREPQGDYESTGTVDRVSADGVTYVIAGDGPTPGGGNPTVVRVTRTVRTADLHDARTYRLRFGSSDDEVFAGTTATGVSSAVLTDIRTKGQSTLTVIDGGSGLGAMLGGFMNGVLGASGADSGTRTASAALLGGGAFTVTGTVKPVEGSAVPFSVILNDRRVDFPARHLRGHLTGGESGQDVDLYVLDDPANALALRYRIGPDSLTVVRIEWPTPQTARLWRRTSPLASQSTCTASRSTSTARIRPSSDSLLSAIAAMMKREPAWKLTISGHTDSVGGSGASNAELSRRRAEAVRVALVARGVSANRLQSGGQGASAPVATNATLAGRARNRRVELTRQ